MFKYSVEMFINEEWIESIRYYYILKDLSDFDLHDIEGKRKNARLLNGPVV